MLTFPLLIAEASPGPGLGQTLGVDWRMFLAYLVCFLIVATVLRLFAYRPVLQMLDERRKRIAQIHADSERVKAELAKGESERRKLLHDVGVRAERLLEEARDAAERLREEEMKRATEEADRILAQARTAAVRDLAQMRDTLQREIGILAVRAAETAARKMLAPADQERLAAETMKDLPA